MGSRLGLLTLRWPLHTVGSVHKVVLTVTRIMRQAIGALRRVAKPRTGLDGGGARPKSTHVRQHKLIAAFNVTVRIRVIILT